MQNSLKSVVQIIVLFVVVSCSSKIITKTTADVESDVSVTDDTLILLIENEDIRATPSEIDAHNKMSESLYNQFGPVTTEFPMFSTTGKKFLLSSNDNHWLVDANKMKKRTAILLFDGKNKPIIEYNVRNYPVLISKYFPKNIRNNNIALEKENQLRKGFRKRLDSLLSISFSPDKKYAEKIINNGGSRYYHIPSSVKCDGYFQTTQYRDTTLKHPSNISKTNYNDGRILTTWSKFLEHNHISEIKYHYSSKNNLLDSITFSSSTEKEDNVVLFKYLPDRYISWHKNLNSMEENFLNNSLQVIKCTEYNRTGQVYLETFCEYDTYGRLFSKKIYFQNEEIQTIVYQYNTPTDKIHSKTTITSADDEDIQENYTFNEKNKHVFISKTNGVINQKFVSDYIDDCQKTTTIYNEDGQVISVIITEKINKL